MAVMTGVGWAPCWPRWVTGRTQRWLPPRLPTRLRRTRGSTDRASPAGWTARCPWRARTRRRVGPSSRPPAASRVPRSGVTQVKSRVTRLRLPGSLTCTTRERSTMAIHACVPSSCITWNGCDSLGSWYTMHAFTYRRAPASVTLLMRNLRPSHAWGFPSDAGSGHASGPTRGDGPATPPRLAPRLAPPRPPLPRPPRFGGIRRARGCRLRCEASIEIYYI